LLEQQTSVLRRSFLAWTFSSSAARCFRIALGPFRGALALVQAAALLHSSLWGRNRFRAWRAREGLMWKIAIGMAVVLAGAALTLAACDSDDGGGLSTTVKGEGKSGGDPEYAENWESYQIGEVPHDPWSVYVDGDGQAIEVAASPAGGQAARTSASNGLAALRWATELHLLGQIKLQFDVLIDSDGADDSPLNVLLGHSPYSGPIALSFDSGAATTDCPDETICTCAEYERNEWLAVDVAIDFEARTMTATLNGASGECVDVPLREGRNAIHYVKGLAFNTLEWEDDIAVYLDNIVLTATASEPPPGGGGNGDYPNGAAGACEQFVDECGEKLGLGDDYCESMQEIWSYGECYDAAAEQWFNCLRESGCVADGPKEEACADALGAALDECH
jgi:hypothetical protein